MRRMIFKEKLLALLLLVASSVQAVEPASTPKSVCMPAYREAINHLSCLLSNYDRGLMSASQAYECEGQQYLRIFVGTVGSGGLLMALVGGPVGAVPFTALFLVGAGGFTAYRGVRGAVIKKMIHGLEGTYFMLEEAFSEGDGIYLRKAYRDVIGDRLDMTEITYEEFVAKIKTLDATGAICSGGDTFSHEYISRKIRKGKL